MPNSASDAMHKQLSLRTDRWSKVLILIAAVAFSLALLLFAAGFAASRIHHKQWNPLGVWAVQAVTNGPVIHLTDTVNVTGTKCNKETVEARGGNQWQQINKPGFPLGASIAGTSGTNTQLKGCHTFHYKNAIPPSVVSYVLTHGTTDWAITGYATPERTSGDGVTRLWRTETFTLTK